MTGTNAAVVCSRIADILTVAGVPSVEVSAEKDDSGVEDTGAFAIRSEYGFMKLYLPADLVNAYESDKLARQKVREAVAGIVLFLKRR